MKTKLVILLASLFILSCQNTLNKEIANAKFVSHRLDFENTLINKTELNILNYLYYYNGAGVALGDFNNDGLIDIAIAGNQKETVLFENKGKLRFEKSTKLPLAKNEFATGLTAVDVNGDGLLDLYRSQVSGHLNLKGTNKLFINTSKKGGLLTFEEKAVQFNLDRKGLFTNASFFDYDLDGDLDVYLLKHSVHPNSNYNRGNIRYKRDSINGDLLLRNDNGYYRDISAEAGIIQSKISYGLGLNTSDINNDGYPDIYIGNDFYENDYIYINQKDGTFKELNNKEKVLGHTSHFSMGNDIADLDNDGLVDIISVDMLPSDLEQLKQAGKEYTYPIYQNQLKNGYNEQFMQNTVHFNNGDLTFSETAFNSGIAASDWSWSPLIFDIDLDGLKDLFITNGILGATNDMDFINFISDSKIQKKISKSFEKEDLKLIREIPIQAAQNRVYRNINGQQFEDLTTQWITPKKTFSNGSAFADLDNDGDLDVVINNLNDYAEILENRTRQQDSSHYLKLKFKAKTKNTNGIGTKVVTYQANNIQYFENNTTHGYLSSSAAEIVIGLADKDYLDSILVVWPNKKHQTLRKLKANQTIVLKEEEAQTKALKNKLNPKKETFITTAYHKLPKHKDGISLEFNRDPLIPFASTNLGPDIAIGDLNNDGLQDIVMTGAKGQKTTIALQEEDQKFKITDLDKTNDYIINEDVTAAIADMNGDQKLDVIIGSGGNEFRTGKALVPRVYLQTKEGLVLQENALENIELNASKINTIDIDNDGDKDLVLTADNAPRSFGKTPKHYVFLNDGKGKFKNVTEHYAKELNQTGNIHDITWVDIDDNGFKDAIIVGHWMPVTILLNNGKKLTRLKSNLTKTNGWWNTVKTADFDKDGDIDIIAGNWGQNTRLNASVEYPITLYNGDFDNNGTTDPIVTYYFNKTETTIATKDELVKQIPYLNKKYLSYKAFSEASISDLFGEKKLKKATKKYVHTLSTTYFENKGDHTFIKHILPFEAQNSSVFDIAVDDFNNDGYKDALLIGNNYEISTQLGRLDASHGVLLINDKKGNFSLSKQQSFNISGPSRCIEKLDINGKRHYIVGRNNDSPILLKKMTTNK